MITDRSITRALRFAEPVLVEALGSQRARDILTAMRAMYPSLRPGLPQVENGKNRMLQRIAVDALALCRALPPDLSQDKKLDLVSRFVNNWMDGQFERWIARFVWSTPVLHRLYRILWFRSVDRADEPDGQWFEYIEPQGNLFYGVNVTRCGLVTYLSREGAPELARLICRGDDYIEKYLPPNVAFERTQVIAEGAPYCDFRYYFV
jgi:hypothetical protein